MNWGEPIKTSEIQTLQEYRNEFLSEPDYSEWLGKTARLNELAREYIRRTDEYDDRICTGPIGRDGFKLPVGAEIGLANRNANRVMDELMKEVSVLGFSRRDFLDRIHREMHYAERRKEK